MVRVTAISPPGLTAHLHNDADTRTPGASWGGGGERDQGPVHAMAQPDVR